MRISLFAWGIIFLVVAGIGILSFIILKVCHFTKNRYYHSFVENELIDSKNKVNSKNDVYFTDNLTYRYIDKYVIIKTSCPPIIENSKNRVIKDINIHYISHTESII